LRQSSKEEKRKEVSLGNMCKIDRSKAPQRKVTYDSAIGLGFNSFGSFEYWSFLPSFLED